MSLAPATLSGAPLLANHIAATTSGTLSAVSSTIIVRRIVKHQRYQGNPYERFILGLSLFDILTSLKSMTLTWFELNEPSPLCTTEGFITVLGTGGPLYNASLSLYYLLVIVYQVPAAKIQKLYEPIIHAVVLSFSISIALAGIGLKAYNPSEWGGACWLNQWPLNCQEEGTCERGAGNLFTFVGGALPLGLVLFTLPVVSAMVVAKVWRIERRTWKYRDPRQSFGGGNTPPPPTRRRRSILFFREAPLTSTEDPTMSQTENDVAMAQPVVQQQPETNNTAVAVGEPGELDIESDGHDHVGEENQKQQPLEDSLENAQQLSTTPKSAALAEEQHQESKEEEKSIKVRHPIDSTTVSSPVPELSSKIKRSAPGLTPTSSEQQQQQPLSATQRRSSTTTRRRSTNMSQLLSNQSQSRKVLTQSLFYVAAFFVQWMPTMILFILSFADPEGMARGDYYVLFFLENLLHPLQGFLNLFVYVRPNYLRRRDMGESRWRSWKTALFGSPLSR